MPSDDEELQRIRERMLRQFMSQGREPSMEVRVVNTEPVPLTDSDFDSFVSSKRYVVVDFWAPWCAPCRMVSPIVEQLAKDYAGKIDFAKVNVDDNPMVASRFMIRSIPTIMFFANGKPVDAVIGAVPRAFLETKIKRNFVLN
ncbi:thiol reductase thioredoxin [Thermogymnomonas acidicola]|uniref:Thiol reductase thioredoxin n=1 Tax=Thermogymnomonas acidicola TaxID=399579 RepID=A0AA37BQS4_9ARCH|nr:thioredoxin [Thermogymnomonas acidicola]GGM71497.1 thiol reductase thioredoxin [Thermogymnomonas acidicola]